MGRWVGSSRYLIVWIEELVGMQLRIWVGGQVAMQFEIWIGGQVNNQFKIWIGGQVCMQVEIWILFFCHFRAYQCTMTFCRSFSGRCWCFSSTYPFISDFLLSLHSLKNIIKDTRKLGRNNWIRKNKGRKADGSWKLLRALYISNLSFIVIKVTMKLILQG